MSQNIIVPHFFLFNCYTLMHVYFTSNRSRIRINHLWNCTQKKLTIDRVKFVFNWKIFLSCTAQLGQISMKSDFTFWNLKPPHFHHNFSRYMMWSSNGFTNLVFTNFFLKTDFCLKSKYTTKWQIKHLCLSKKQNISW